MDTVYFISILGLLFGVILAFLRFLKGPNVTDKILSFDTISIMITSMLVILALYFEREVYLDIAFIFGVIGFIGVVVFAKFLEKDV